MNRALQLRVFGLTWLSYASYYLCRKNFSVSKARLEEDYGVSVAELATIDTLYLALYAGGNIAMGALGDRLGARRMIAIGMIGAAAMAWLFSFGGGTFIFGVAFGLQGLFQSTGWPNNVKAMEPFFGKRGRGTVMGLWCTNYQVGGIAATALATALLVAYGWREAFRYPGLITLGVGILVWLFLPSPERGLAEEDDKRSNSTRLPILEVLRLPAVWSYGGSHAFLKLIRYSLLFWLPLYLNRAHGYDEETAGYLSTTFEIGGIVGAIVTGYLSDRFFSDRRARLLVPMMFALVFVLLGYQLFGGLGMVVNGVLMAAIGVLIVGPEALITAAIPQDLGGRKAAGSAAGLINGIGSFGAMLQGAVTAGVEAAWGFEALFYVFVGLALLAALALTPFALKRAADS